MNSRLLALPALFALAVIAGACQHDDEHGEGEASGAVCPAESKVTYDNFARNFVKEYCTACHASTLTGIERHGAPEDHNLDSHASIKKVSAHHLDMVAAAGPDAVNTVMPPEGWPMPTELERKKLGEWLACDMP